MTREEMKAAADASWGQAPNKPQAEVAAMWPSPDLAKQMMDSADTNTDPGCHIRALLARIQELEQERRWLKRCEAAMESMARQFCCPKTTAKQMVDQVLANEEKANASGT